MESLVSNKVGYNTRFTKDTFQWKPFFRQLLIVSSAWTLYFYLGLHFGSPTVVIPQLRRANITVSDEMVSWLSSGIMYGAIPWVFIHSILAHTIGWRKTSILVSIATITSAIVFFFSTTPTILLISEIISGVTQGATASIYVVLISEYTSPEYRGLFLCIKSASFLWGIWLANAIGTFTFWRYIPALGIIVSLHTLTVFFWPESPRWLASKNRFAECRKAHRWLKGDGKNAELELFKLIQFQREESASESIYTFKKIRFVSQREFYLPLSLCMLAIISYHLSGKLVITVYAVDLIKKIIKNETTTYYTMLALDGVTVLGAYVGCLLAKICKRRTVWLTTCCLAISFTLLLSLYIYLVKLSICSENIYLAVCLLAGFSMSISCGPMVLALAFSGELIPYKYKSISIVMVALWFVVLNAIFLKVSPLMIKTLSIHGTFLFYALSSGFCACLMYLFLPETKDKTLLEIEEYFSNKKTVEESNKLVE